MIEDFLARSRWFGGKGRTFAVTGQREAARLGGDPEVVLLLVEVTYDDPGAPAETELYQLPFALYDEPQPRLEHAHVGRWPDGRTAYDAVHDSAAMHVLMGASDWHRLGGWPELGEDVVASAFSGEQSNSTVLFGEEAALKVFRKVTPGENPDITTHRALTEAGSTHVAELYGWLEAGSADGTEGETLQLALLQQFLRTATDGWELALASVRSLYAEAEMHPGEHLDVGHLGGDFAGEAARLGAALAEVHEQLRVAFPVDRVPTTQIVEGMRHRLAATARAVPQVAPFVVPLQERYDALLDLGDLDVQRIHGDLHLGQTLRTVVGWKLVDFEGEPAKSLADRLRPDTPWRDVAGMLRSFDYAAHALFPAEDPVEPELTAARLEGAREWARRNQVAFLAAYVGGDPATLIPARELTPEEDAIVTAYIADKAVYECLYEARNRQAWLDLPLGALARLVGGEDD
ncbi:maltokinase N-terminal cap-like domain-containing protein [Nocardioides ultimimeridianus]